MKKIIIYLMFIVSLVSSRRVEAQVKNILLEEFSTAPCGFCPDGDIIAAQLVNKYPNVIWVTHHAGFGVDSMTAPNSRTIAGTFTTFAPAACLNRWDIPLPPYTKEPFIAISRQKWDSIAGAHQQDTAKVEIEIINDYDSLAKTLNSKVNVVFIKEPGNADFRINLFLVEDSVVGYGTGYDQKNYYNNTSGHPMYGRGNPIVGYVHHRVVRKIPSGAWGINGIIPDNPSTGVKYTYTFKDIDISAKWKKSDMDVVAFVSRYDTDPHKRPVLQAISKKMTDRTTVIGNSDNEYTNELIVVPSPVRDHFTVNPGNKDEKIETITVYNCSGKIIYSQNNIIDSKIDFPAKETGLTPGVYFIRVTTGSSRMYFSRFVHL